MDAIKRMQQLRTEGLTFELITLRMNKEKFRTKSGGRWQVGNLRHFFNKHKDGDSITIDTTIIPETSFLNVVLNRSDLSNAQKVGALQAIY